MFVMLLFLTALPGLTVKPGRGFLCDCFIINILDMQKNQLRLRIWNTMNHLCLSVQKIEYLEQQLSDAELGAVINLCSDSREAMALLEAFSAVKDCDCATLKNTAARYLAFYQGSALSAMRQRLCMCDLEDMIHALAESAKENCESNHVTESFDCLLDYARMLRSKLDCPEISLADVEERLFTAFNLEYDGAFLYDAFTLFAMCMDGVSDVDRLAGIFETHQLALEQYLKRINDEFMCVVADIVMS